MKNNSSHKVYEEKETQTDCNIIIHDGILYYLDEEEKTSSLSRNIDSNGDVIIPRCVYYQNQEYNVTVISRKSFAESENIESIQFPKDSKVEKIEEDAFRGSSIQMVSFPSSLIEISKNAFSYCEDLEYVFFDENSKLKIIGDDAFSCALINEISIPSHVIRIGCNAFSDCDQLTTVEIPENSELQIIENCAFFDTIIESIFIPEHLKELMYDWCYDTKTLTNFKVHPKNKFFKTYEDKYILKKLKIEDELFDVLCFARRDIKEAKIPNFIKCLDHDSFENCTQLTRIEFPEDSEIKTIENSAFFGSEIESIFIPESLIELKSGWCNETPKLMSFKIHPNNKFFKSFDDKIILWKSKIESDFFDVLVFACRNVEKVTIPKFVKRISEYSFKQCTNLINVEFPVDSELEIIEKGAFADSSLERIRIPSNTTLISSLSFSESSLKAIEIPQNSKLTRIGKFAFSGLFFGSVFIPSNVTKIGQRAFYCCENLQIVEIDKNPNIELLLIQLLDDLTNECMIMTPHTFNIEDKIE